MDGHQSDYETDPIDYRRMGEEIEAAHRRATQKDADEEANASVLVVVSAIFGALAGFVTHRWWVGVLALVGAGVLWMPKTLRWFFYLSFAGLSAYLGWTVIQTYWATASVIPKAGISIAVAALGTFLHEAATRKGIYGCG